MEKEKDFGWTTCKKLCWARDTKDGKLKFYEGKFKTDRDRDGRLTITTVLFWTNRPTLAMRYIYEKSDTIQNVERFNYKEIIITKTNGGEYATV